MQVPGRVSTLRTYSSRTWFWRQDHLPCGSPPLVSYLRLPESARNSHFDKLGVRIALAIFAVRIPLTTTSASSKFCAGAVHQSEATCAAMGRISMQKNLWWWAVPCALLILLATGVSQTGHSTRSLSVNGHTGEAIIYQIDGKSYVDIE